LTDEKAAEVADVLMVDAWLGRTERKFTTTRKFTTYLPTDVVTVNDGGFSYVGRITQKLENGPVIEWTMRDEASATYSPNVVPSPSGSGGVIGSVSYNGDMRLQLLDIPAAIDSHTSDAGFYASAAGYREAFRGGVLFKSADAITYNNLQTLTTSIQGHCLTALPDFAGGNVVDELSSVDVVVYAGETLSSIDRAAHMNGGNLCVVGSELLMYRSAVLIGADTYRLTGLLRGRRGTEQHSGAHAVGDRFVLLDARVARVAQNLPVGEDYYKGVAIGFALSDTVQQRFTNTAAALKPLSPAHLQAVDIGGGDYAVQWVRRGRVAANWMDGVDVPLGETSEAYAVEVSDEYDVEIISSTTVTSPSATITASSGYIVRVYQLSATVGRGFPAVTTIA
jgi:hypothetical protein